MKEALMILVAVLIAAIIIGGIIILEGRDGPQLLAGDEIEWPGVDPNRYGGFLFFYDCNDPNWIVYGDIVFVGQCHHQLTLGAANDVVTLSGPDVNDGLMGLYVLLSKGKQPTKQVTFQVKETKSQADEIDNTDSPPIEIIDVNDPNYEGLLISTPWGWAEPVDVNDPNYWFADFSATVATLHIGGIETDIDWLDPNEPYFEIYLDANGVVQVETRNCSLSEAAELLFDKVKECGGVL